MSCNVEDIKLKINHKVRFNFEDKKIKNLLIFGNTIRFFGFFDKDINMMSMQDNDRTHLFWLLKRAKEGTKIYIIGEQEEIDYYQNLFNWISRHAIKCNVKYLKTIKPIDYINKLNNELKNMTFDYIVGNPPFGSVGGDTLHLKCIDRVFDKFNKKMLIIMPWGFVTKDTRSFKKYQIKFAPKLQHVKEIAGNNFEGTSMPSAAIYEFTNEETKTTILEDLSGNKTEKTDLTNVSQFTPYEEEIIKYLETINPIKICYTAGGYDRYWKNYKNKLNENDFYNWRKTNIDKLVKDIKDNYYNNSYLITNCDNGACNGNYMTSNTGLIINGFDNLYKWTFTIKPIYRVLIFNSEKSAYNCKLALERSLLRFILYKTQIDQHIYDKKTYKYVPAIDWEDERCLTDEGLLEMCGCPKDKAKEYAEYVKNYVEERDKEFENKKKK